MPKDIRLNSTHFSIINIPNKRELQQIPIYYLSDVDFKGNLLRFRRNFFRIKTYEILTIDDQIKNEKLPYDINREAAKISVSSSGKINKYEYLTSEEILPSNQKQIIEQAKLTYSPFGKAFAKQTKAIEDQG